jgi:hypothetical protein
VWGDVTKGEGTGPVGPRSTWPVVLLFLLLTAGAPQDIGIGAFHGHRTIIEPGINLSYIYTEDRIGLFRDGRARLTWHLRQDPGDVEWWPSKRPRYSVYLTSTLDLSGTTRCELEICWSSDPTARSIGSRKRVIDQKSLRVGQPDRFTEYALRAHWLRLSATAQDGQQVLFEFDLEGLQNALDWVIAVPDQNRQEPAFRHNGTHR